MEYYSTSKAKSKSNRGILQNPSGRSISSSSLGSGSGQKKSSCMCSPTTHPGSFRCSLHKQASGSRSPKTASFSSHRLNARRSAMTNSLVRIGKVERDLVRRTLAALIRPSSNQQRRRGDFRHRPTRLSIMSKA